MALRPLGGSALPPFIALRQFYQGVLVSVRLICYYLLGSLSNYHYHQLLKDPGTVSVIPAHSVLHETSNLHHGYCGSTGDEGPAVVVSFSLAFLNLLINFTNLFLAKIYLMLQVQVCRLVTACIS